MHQLTSDALELKELIDLSHPIIHIGPFTLLTVDEGYAAITQDNGKQRVLAVSATHMLMHRNRKFQKFISLKIRKDDLGPFQATTVDNVVLATSATVNWRVEDAKLAPKMAADTMVSTGPRTDTSRSGPSLGIMRVSKTLVQFHQHEDPGPRSGRRCACGSSRGAHSLARYRRSQTRGQPPARGCPEGRVSEDPRPRRRV